MVWQLGAPLWRVVTFVLAAAHVTGLVALATPSPSSLPDATPSPSSSPDASPSPFVNPFCSVGFMTSAWDASTNSLANAVTDRLIGRLFLDSSNPSARLIGAHLILLSDSQAYEADLSKLIVDSSKERRTSPFFISLPSAMSVKYVYVDSYTVDDGKSIDCPTQVSSSGDLKWTAKEFPATSMAASISAIPVVSARFRQALPPLPCGKIHIQAKVTHAVRPNWPYGLSKSAQTQIAVFIDSRGTVVRADVYKSSGSEDADAQAQFAAYSSTYAPALFLCQPVVGEYLFTADFQF